MMSSTTIRSPSPSPPPAVLPAPTPLPETPAVTQKIKTPPDETRKQVLKINCELASLVVLLQSHAGQSFAKHVLPAPG